MNFKRPTSTGKARRGFFRDERGVTAIEFGLLALPFFGIIAAILQTSVIFLASQVLESAVQDASRNIRTGHFRPGATSLDVFRSEICNGTYGLLPNCSTGLHIRVREVTNFETATMVVPIDLNCEAPCNWNQEELWLPGAGKSVVLAQVFFRYPVLIPLGPFGMSNLGDGSRLIGSATVFQNEPFTF